MTNYLVITAARDEEAFLPGLIGSVTNQTVTPRRWILIDDGSSDATPLIAEQAAQRFPWIELHRLPTMRPRSPGGESVITRFLSKEVWEQFDFVLRLDADISFAPNFVELLLREFARDARLGIASALLLELKAGRWREVPGPAFHTRGAIKMYTRACLEAIGGLDGGLGWDTLDEARAMMKGFKTRSFPHIRAFHHRPAGAASGHIRSRLAMGRAAFRAGYSPLFMAVRALRHCVVWPPIVAGVLMMAGYVEGYLRGDKPVAEDELIRFIRKQQMLRLQLKESLWR